MSDIDLAKLKVLAMAATPGGWTRDAQSGLDADVRAPHPDFPHRGYPVALTWGLWRTPRTKEAYERRKATANANADFIAAANPAVVLHLLELLATATGQPNSEVPRVRGQDDGENHD